MNNYTAGEIASIVNGSLKGNSSLDVSTYHFDSRKIISPENGLFIALKTNKANGHDFIKQAFSKGITTFLVNRSFRPFKGATFILCDEPLTALQRLAKHHKNQLNHPILAVTGSNGKTIVKQWLNDVLSKHLQVQSSFKSFNSQLGVPLSILQLKNSADISIVEAGISRPNEMQKLEEIIQPEFGIFTTIGSAHLENFKDEKRLIKEKCALFKNSEWVVVSEAYQAVITELKLGKSKVITWGKSNEADYKVSYDINQSYSLIRVHTKEEKVVFQVPFIDNASLENVTNVIITCLKLNLRVEKIKAAVLDLIPLKMRLQVLSGINGCTIINDAYTLDFNALKYSLQLADKYANGRPKTLIVSKPKGFLGEKPASFSQVLKDYDVNKVLTVDSDLAIEHISHKNFKDVLELLAAVANADFKDEIIIIKGARKYEFEKITNRLQARDHQTVLEVNLAAITHNLEYFKSKLLPNTGVMGMIKASSYGSGAFEVASHLSNLGLKYLAVAYTDEGIELRKKGVNTPILVLNPEPSAFDSLLRFNLEPEIYSLELFRAFLSHLRLVSQKNFPIHIKLNTGMNRLGFNTHEIPELIELITAEEVKIKTVFSHLAASDSAEHKQFTLEQIKLYDDNTAQLEKVLPYAFLKHISNTAGIENYPEAEFDLVRLGIGLYGISSSAETQKLLKPVLRLKTTIIQVRTVEAGESIGYKRNFIAKRKMRIGIVPIGYADGLHRSLGNGQFNFKIGNQKVPTVGIICMDMTFIDLTNSTAKTGDTAVVFSNAENIKELADLARTIPYEIISSISYRVKRTYLEE